MLASCHTVIANINSEGESIYTASSPDEYAIINFTKFVGVEFRKLDDDNNIII